MKRGPALNHVEGFTLIELLVSMSIFAVMSALVMVNFRVGERSDELRLGAQTFASLIRDAESRASSGVTVCLCLSGDPTGPVCTAERTCPGGGTPSDTVPRGGYGIHVGTGELDAMLFADLDANRIMNAGEVLLTEKFSASGGVRVSAGGGDMVFVPPRPDVWINGAQAAQEFSVTLEQLLNNTRREVRYNRISRRIEDQPL
ncbi:prepilin-type N-terminal cleavage/methylation domain-containing protein [Patescibacteria group bacterium]|nr:MAG: prepilin-type N-terminal cleavage/methylation domain-containing protein [Patescibacteria group bacterium]